MNKSEKIYIAGHRGLVGSAIVRRLQNEGYKNLILKTRNELDLLDFQAVQSFFNTEHPDYVFLAAAKVGGIYANNTEGADFIYENLTIQNNVIKCSHDTKVKKLLFLGSSCIYPRNCPQPMREEYFLDGKPEPTNTPYAAAKIAGILMCQAFFKQYNDTFISVMPTNLYGPNDNFDLISSHVFPALIRKFYEAKVSNLPTVTVWGTGTVLREFLHVDDLASAAIFLMNTYDQPEIINIGTGQDVTIKQLAEMIMDACKYNGKITWDSSKPDGMPRKLLDVSKINALGWKASIELRQGIESTLQWYSQHAISK
jgi:GDP-L-fucose synthase